MDGDRTSRCCTAAWTPTSASSCGWRSRPTRPSTRSASCSPPTPPARASTCSGTATAWSTTTSRSTRTGWSSASAASTATASRSHPTSATSSAPAGSHAVDAYRGRPGVPRPGRAQGRHGCEADLGSVNAVLADAVQRRMLGEQVDVWTSRRPTPAAGPDLPVDTDVPRAGPPAARAARHHRRGAGHHPGGGARASSTPPWSWPGSSRCARTSTIGASTTGCSTSPRSPARGTGRPPGWPRSWRPPTACRGSGPVTFDPAAAANRDDVVLAHLNHPLVAMSTRLLRAAVSQLGHRPAPGDRRASATTRRWRTCWSARTPGSCWSARTASGCTRRCCTPAAGCPSAAGSAAWRTSGALRGRPRPRALADGAPAPPHVQARLAERWPARPRRRCCRAIDWRTERRGAVAGAQARRARAGGAGSGSPTGSTGSPPPCAAALAEDDADAEQALFSRAEAGEEPRRARPVPPRPAVLGRAPRPACTHDRERELAAVAAPLRRPPAAPLPGGGRLRGAATGGRPMRPRRRPRPPGRRPVRPAPRLARADRGHRPVPVRCRCCATTWPTLEPIDAGRARRRCAARTPRGGRRRPGPARLDRVRAARPARLARRPAVGRRRRT